MDFDVNQTIGELAMDTSLSQDVAHINFPVVPLVVSISVILVALIVFVVLYAVRRRRNNRYHDYTPISRKSLKPDELAALPYQETPSMSKKIPSEISLTRSSSELSYEDDNDIKSIHIRETSPDRSDPENIYPEDHIGKIWFTASYDSNSESLTVVLQKIENLPNRSSTVRSCDPCVKISLLPSNKKVAQSRYKRKNKNPVFNETFEISLPVFDLSKTTLCLTVVDGYRSNQQSTVGLVLLPLKDLHNNAKLQKDLVKPPESCSNLGQLHVSLSYYPTLNRLTAIILRATSLTRSTHRSLDSYVKVSFSIGNKVMRTKKTAIHTDTQSPMFNESFDFMVNEDSLGTSTLLISVMQSGGGVMEDKLIGRLLLGGRMYARGRACDHWLDMMSNSRKMVKCWHELQGY